MEMEQRVVVECWRGSERSFVGVREGLQRETIYTYKTRPSGN